MISAASYDSISILLIVERNVNSVDPAACFGNCLF